MTTPADFPALLSRFFNTHLIQQRQASPHTVASYRDTFRLLVHYAQEVLGKPPQDLAVDDLDTAFLTSFLHHLESERYARQPVDYLDSEEINALLRAPDQSTWVGRRDHTLLLVAVQTGMRASELIRLLCADVHLGTGAHVRCHGKGRKKRCVPLRRDSVAAIGVWLKERCGHSDDPVFVNQRAGPLTHDSLEYLVTKNLAVARTLCPTLRRKRITPHSLRHSCAMELLHGGVDQATIALWLGHEALQTTYIYLHADLKLKERAMAKTTPSGTPVQRYQPEDRVLAYLNSL